MRKKIPNLEYYITEQGGITKPDLTPVYTFFRLAPTPAVCVMLYQNGKRKQFRVAHLVLQTYRPNIPQARFVKYLDGDPRNTHLTNLQWQHPTIPIKQIQQAYQDGMTQQQIADKFGVHQTRVSQLCRGLAPEVCVELDDGWGRYADTDYFVHTSGKVVRASTQHKGGKTRSRVMTEQMSRHNYRRVRVLTKQGYVSMSIHRLVALVHIPNPHNLPQVDHIDGDPSNNDVSNLRWCTGKQNMEYRSPMRQHALAVVEMYRSGATQKEVAATFGCSINTVQRILYGKVHADITGIKS